MFSVKWNQWRVTDSAQRILRQVPPRAIERGLVSLVADDATIAMLALFTVLLGERKVGLVALERAGGNRFDLSRALDRLLREKASELPTAFDAMKAVDHDNPQRGAVEAPKPDGPFVDWESDALLEPLLCQAQHEAKELGHNYIGSEHLVLAIVKLADPMLSAMLRECGVSYARVREAVIALLLPVPRHH